MALKNTVVQLRTLLGQVTKDLDKAERGNKAASQRVRTGTIKLEKTAKLFRKESVKADKENKGRPKVAKKATTAKKATSKKTAAPKKGNTKKAAAPKKAAPTKKKVTARRSAMSFERQRSAKLPRR